MKIQRKLDDGELREQKYEVKYLLFKYVEGEDIDVFFRLFERLVNLYKWLKLEWVLWLVFQLMGKVFDSYVWLGEGELNDYDVIKKVILKRYNLIVSIYKDKFRICK